MPEIDLSDAPMVEFAMVDEAGYQRVLEAVLEFNEQTAPARLSVDDIGFAPYRRTGWPWLVRTRVREDDMPDLLEAAWTVDSGLAFSRV